MSSPGAKLRTLSKARSYDHINLLRTQDYSAEHGAGFGRDRAKVAAEPSSFNGAMNRSSSSNGISSRAGSFLGLRGTPPAPSVNKALLNALANDRTIRSVPVTEIMPVELARQLTLYVGNMFLDIPYLELLTRDRPNCSKMAKTATEVNEDLDVKLSNCIVLSKLIRAQKSTFDSRLRPGSSRQSWTRVTSRSELR